MLNIHMHFMNIKLKWDWCLQLHVIYPAIIGRYLNAGTKQPEFLTCVLNFLILKSENI